MALLVSDYFYRMVSTLYHFATPSSQQHAQSDPVDRSFLYNYSLNVNLSSGPDLEYHRTFDCWGFPSDTFALSFVERHPYFSFFL